MKSKFVKLDYFLHCTEAASTPTIPFSLVYSVYTHGIVLNIIYVGSKSFDYCLFKLTTLNNHCGTS